MQLTRRFVADAGHELNTPIAIHRGKPGGTDGNFARKQRQRRSDLKSSLKQALA